MKINPIFSLIKEYLASGIDFDVFSMLLSKDLFYEFDPGPFSSKLLENLQKTFFDLIENFSNQELSIELLTTKILSLYIDQIQEMYQAFGSHIMDFMKKRSEEFSDSKKRRVLFVTQLFIDGMYPSNFVLSNKEILQDLFRNPKSSIFEGFSRYFEDLKKGKSLFDLPITDEEAFKLGKNIACTPGKIIFQNEIMQLIQYNPTTTKAFTNPVLIVPAWINKYYIFDMQQKNSFVKMLVDEGFSVFIISWVNPNKKHKNTLFFDYLKLGPLQALQEIKKVFTKSQINLVGYCLGGTLSACLLSLLAKKNEDELIASATFLTTPLDFSECHNLKIFSDKRTKKIVENEIKKTGFLRGDFVKNFFNLLRARDTIYPAFINYYFKKSNENPFDILYWHSDPLNIAPKVQSFFYNKLLNQNKLALKKTQCSTNDYLDLSEINKPCYFVGAKKDHIIPWTTCYKSQKYLQGSSRFILTDAGHVAGIINPPNSKYGYWECNVSNNSPDEFLDKSKFIQDTWWHDWVRWLKPYSGKLAAIKKNQNVPNYFIEEAPGAYAQQKWDSPS